MILIIIFTLIILAGVSFLAAVIGTSFLKKRSYRRKNEDYRSVYKDQYEIKVGELEKEEAKENKKDAGESKGVGYYYEKKAAFKFKWILIFLGMIVIVFIASFFGYQLYQKIKLTPKMYICEGVDFEKLKPIHKSNTFIRGNVDIFVKSKVPLKTKGIKVDVYKIDSKGLETFASKKLDVNPDWTSFSLKVLFDKIGTFRVVVSKDNGELISEKRVYIVPDKYAFKAIKE